MGRNPASHAKPAKRKPAEQRDPKHRSGKNAAEAAFAGKARWTDKAWEDYLWWREQDPKIFARINALIEDTLRNPFRGSAARLAALFGLTEAQARVAREFSIGGTYEQVARRLGVTVETVRSHIKDIYPKTRVNRQADLVRLVLSLARSAV